MPTMSEDIKVLDLFWSYLHQQHGRSYETVRQNQRLNPKRFDAIASRYLNWLYQARKGEQGLQAAIDAYVVFSTEVLFAQAKYEQDSHYEHETHAQCNEALYSRRDRMDDYLWGVFITNFAWTHHFEISLFYEDRFFPKLTTATQIYELAPGHGGWGLWLLDSLPKAQLKGIDISPSSIAIASSLADAAGLQNRVEYLLSDVLQYKSEPQVADACVCNFLIEHLEHPEDLFAKIYDLLKPGAVAFVSGAVTAAQEDHIYEYKSEGEVVAMAESEGFRLLELLSLASPKMLPNARYMPRSIAMILKKDE